MRFQSFFQVFTVSDVEVAIFFAFQNIGVVHKGYDITRGRSEGMLRAERRICPTRSYFSTSGKDLTSLAMSIESLWANRQTFRSSKRVSFIMGCLVYLVYMVPWVY